MPTNFPYVSLEAQYATGLRSLTQFEEVLAQPFKQPALERLRLYVFRNILKNNFVAYGIPDSYSIALSRAAAIRSHASSLTNELGLLIEGTVPTPISLLLPDAKDAFGDTLKASPILGFNTDQKFIGLSFGNLTSNLYQNPIITDLEQAELQSIGIPSVHIDLLRRYTDSLDPIINAKIAVVTVVLVARQIYSGSPDTI